MAMFGAQCSPCCDNCERRACSFTGGFVTPTESGDCEDKEGCCCIQDPEGACVDESVLDENGELTVPLNEAIVRGHCVKCCANEVIFSMLASTLQPADPNDRPRVEAAAEWVQGVRDWLEANGYTNVSYYNLYCSKGGSDEVENDHVVWVRACCDGEYSTDTDDCYSVYTAAPADTFGLTPQVNIPGGGNPCAGLGGGPWIPLCLPNPLP